MIRMLAALTILSLAMMQASQASSDSSLAHVTVKGTVRCKSGVAQTRPKVNVWLANIIVTGREDFPQVLTQWLDDEHVDFSFDVPGGVYELFANLGEQTPQFGACSWNGLLMTLPGVARDVAVALEDGLISVWDRGDFLSGTVAGAASVRGTKMPLAEPCGERWTPANDDDLADQRGDYYAEIPWLDSQLQTPALIVTDRGHTIVLKLPRVIRAPLHQHAYYRRDITEADLERWASFPAGSVVCDSESRTYGQFSPAQRVDLQQVEVTAIIACSDRNDLYTTEIPALQVEDQLHRGTFYAPPVVILSHKGNVLRLRFAIAPGAYDLGMRLPPPKGRNALPCYSSARFAVLPGYGRKLTQLICTCTEGGSNRGFVAGEMLLPSVNVAVAVIPLSVQCDSEVPDFNDAYRNRTIAVLDGDHYYGTYTPYDPWTQPVLILSGNGLATRFVALDPNHNVNVPRESLKILNLTAERVASWYGSQDGGKLICPGEV